MAEQPATSYSEPLIVHVDGAAWGNPGPAGFGYVIRDARRVLLAKRGEFIGETTNNVAEYKGMIAAASRAAELGAVAADFCVDSELLERQVNGVYRVKARHLKPLFAELMSALRRIPRWSVRYVPREHNGEADALAKRAVNLRGVVT